jgi:two-component system response regulator GlrR
MKPSFPPPGLKPSFPPPGDDTKVQAFGLRAPRPQTHPTLRWTDASGARTTVLKERSMVGSAPNAGLVIADRTVSRIHAELEPRDDGAWVRDLGSRNGTFVEGVLITGARIPDGGKVRFGSTEVVFDYALAEDPVDLWEEPSFGRLLGASIPMRQLFAYIARIAPSDSPVLIEGETGTGKELVAHAIHDASPRASKPFVIVDCAALPENLIESELFGHAKGAFTGALRTRIGAIESADGGTVFLDEIGELPLAMQPHLLRVLETGTIRMVGETARKKVDVRFISATHRDIRTMVNAGAFREDLYFRLAVLPVAVPPLRERRDDIPSLVQAFLPKGVLASPEVLRELLKRPWLGNVRELRNFVHRAAAIGTHKALHMSLEAGSASDGRIPLAGSETRIPAAAPLEPPAEPLLSSVSFDGDYKTFREQWTGLGEREYLKRLLVRHGRNVAAAAREAGVDRTYIYRLIRNHAL